MAIFIKSEIPALCVPANPPFNNTCILSQKVTGNHDLAHISMASSLFGMRVVVEANPGLNQSRLSAALARLEHQVRAHQASIGRT
jgi:hypothetical protein